MHNADMKYRAVIRDAWHLTQENKKLIWWFAFAPALLTSLVSIVYIAYQVAAFWSSPFIRASAAGQDDIFTFLVKTSLQIFEEQPGLGVVLIVIIGIIGLAYLMLPVFTQGALIQLVTRIRKHMPISIVDGVSYGLGSFLPMFEYHLLIKTFSWVTVVTNAAFILRMWGPKSLAFFSWIFGIVLIVGFLLTLLFTFSEYYIVLEKKPVLKSMILSSGLVIRQWHHILFILLLMVLITLRIVINIFIALLVPILIIAPILFFTSITLAVLGVIIGSIIGLVSLYFASYFLGVYHLFATAVWTFAFLELTAKEAHEGLQLKGGESEEDQIENEED